MGVTERTLKRFLSKIDKDGPIVEPFLGKCWLWLGATNKDTGYGTFWINERNEGAHRASYVLLVGQIKKGYHVLHKCDVRNCVNPKHLFQGTHTDNMRDKSIKGRHVSADPSTKARGEGVGNSKFTEIQIYEIRKQFDSGLYSQRELARKFRTRQTNIGFIGRRETWKHLPERI